jgi:hypothetical protein
LDDIALARDQLVLQADRHTLSFLRGLVSYLETAMGHVRRLKVGITGQLERQTANTERPPSHLDLISLLA